MHNFELTIYLQKCWANIPITTLIFSKLAFKPSGAALGKDRSPKGKHLLEIDYFHVSVAKQT